MHRIRILLFAVAVAAGAAFAQDPAPFVVHEWGTFTQLVLGDGEPRAWHPAVNDGSLPGFVDSLELARTKDGLAALVRMETPVIYFYAGQPLEASVSVRFQGMITEWFPTATLPEIGRELRWPKLRIRPGSEAPLPDDGTESHYYAARATDAAVVEVDVKGGVERDRFLFYRGLGSFGLPLRVQLDPEGDRIRVENRGAHPIPRAIVFERRGEVAAFALGEALGAGAAATVARPRGARPLDALRRALVTLLVESGLFEKEAEAMFETWKATWSSEGLRVLSIVPRPLTDELLALEIAPKPDRLERVMVARTEILTPEDESRIASLAAAFDDPDAAARAAALAGLRRYGRFGQPVWDRFLAALKDDAARLRCQQFLDAAGDTASEQEPPPRPESDAAGTPAKDR